MDPRARNRYLFKPKLGLYSFMDETGNTGLNLLDQSQPLFILGNAFSTKNIDVEGKIYFKEIYQKIQKSELHANEIGNKGLADVSSDLVSLINDLDIHFHFSVIEKKHYLKIILFHHFYDNGPNPAVNAFALGARSLRLLLSLHFIQLVEDNHLNKYLLSLKNRDLKLYSEIHADLAKKVKESPFDYRTKELLYDALIYTAQNPKEIFESMSLDKICSPNNQAFVLMINQMHENFKDTAIFKEMTHDEQLEFGKSIKQSYNFFSPMYQPSSPTTLLGDHKDSPLLKGTKFSLRPSIESLGLQTIDPALWLFKRNMLLDKEDHPDFWYEIMTRTSFSGVTFMLHVNEVEQNKMQIKSRHISEKQLLKGHNLIRDIEKNRWKAEK